MAAFFDECLKALEAQSQYETNAQFHNSTNSNLPFNNAGSSIKSSEYDDNIKLDSTVYICNICSVQCSTRKELKKHRRIHAEPITCEICQKIYYEKCLYERHMRIHNGERPFKCETCNKGFTTSSSLNHHQIIHTGIKPFQCDVCDARFNNRTTLKRHLQLHTGERPYVCDECGKTFSVKSSLKYHQDIHVGVKQFECKICKREFMRKSSLQRHRLLHSVDEQFACDVCPKRFTTRENLTNHLRSHTGEKPFSCDICNKKFSNEVSCKRHHNLHNESNLIPCDVCDKKFLTLSNMKFHYKRIHDPNSPHKRRRIDKPKQYNNPSQVKPKQPCKTPTKKNIPRTRKNSKSLTDYTKSLFSDDNKYEMLNIYETSNNDTVNCESKNSLSPKYDKLSNDEVVGLESDKVMKSTGEGDKVAGEQLNLCNKGSNIETSDFENEKNTEELKNS